ncbi:hypothetical protein L1887_28332 [Cichorium endivia]|nr:hypothetical protein L1887_28332 [Cichorium endivia]
MQYGGYQPNMPQQGPPNMMQYPHQQDHRPPFSQREDGNQVGFSPSQIPQSGVQNPIQTPPPGQVATQYGGPQFSMQQPSSFGQHGPNFQNQMGQPLLHGQQPNVPPVGMKMGFEDNPPGRGGNDPYYNAKNDGPPHQPKLAAIPMARAQSEMNPGGPASHNMYGQAMGGPPFMNNAMMRPNPSVMASPDAMNLSSVDVYRQKHDVSATGDNVPAPFMSFESAGLPPELLREVRYLL